MSELHESITYRISLMRRIMDELIDKKVESSAMPKDQIIQAQYRECRNRLETYKKFLYQIIQNLENDKAYHEKIINQNNEAIDKITNILKDAANLNV